MRIISLFTLFIPLMMFSQSTQIETRAKYALNGEVKYYKKEYLVKPSRVRGFVKSDIGEIDTYVDIPRILELNFNRQGYATSSKGTRFSANGGDWEKEFEYFNIGDTLKFQSTLQNYGANTTFDYEFHFRDDKIVYQYEREKHNFETIVSSVMKITHKRYNDKNRLIETKSLETTKYTSGKIDTVSTATVNTYYKDKIWSWQHFYKGVGGQIHYYPFLGSEKYFTRTDSVFTWKNELKLIKTMVANDIQVIHKYNFAENNINKSIIKYDERGRQLSRTRFYYNSIEEDTYSSAVIDFTTYFDDEQGTIKSDAFYNINSETNLIGDRQYFKSYDREGRVLQYIAPEVTDYGYETPEKNIEYEYIENTGGYLIKIIKKNYLNQKSEIDEITNYKYDKKNNLIYEKILDSDNNIISEIKYLIEYYTN